MTLLQLPHYVETNHLQKLQKKKKKKKKEQQQNPEISETSENYLEPLMGLRRRRRPNRRTCLSLIGFYLNAATMISASFW
jgi:hypothetical protein